MFVSNSHPVSKYPKHNLKSSSANYKGYYFKIHLNSLQKHIYSFVSAFAIISIFGTSNLNWKRWRLSDWGKFSNQIRNY